MFSFLFDVCPNLGPSWRQVGGQDHPKNGPKATTKESKSDVMLKTGRKLILDRFLTGLGSILDPFLKAFGRQVEAFWAKLGSNIALEAEKRRKKENKKQSYVENRPEIDVSSIWGPCGTIV